MCDQNGLPLTVLVSAANTHDSQLMLPLLDSLAPIRSPRGRPRHRPDKLHAAGIQDNEIYFVGTRELEDLFDDDQWADTANMHWPRDDGEKWTTEDFASLRQADKFSKAIENKVRGCSSDAPPRKTGYLVALVQGLTEVEEVPADLVTIFRDLACVETT